MGLGIVISVDGVPDADLAQASRVEVYERLGETTWYSIHYLDDIEEGDLPYIKDGRLSPGSELSILVEVDSQLECLVKGPVCSQQIHFEHGGPGSWLEVKGADNSITMDRELQSKVWADVTDGEAVMAITAGYAMVPDVASTKTRHLEFKHSLVQRETDLRFIRRLARRNGCYFWISYPEPGLEIAHFQRPDLDSQPAADIKINQDNPDIEALDISWDVERPTSVEGKQLDLNTKNAVNGDVGQTPQTILGDKSLQDITGDTRSMHVTAPSDDAGNLQARSEGALIESDWFVRANCSTSLFRLGKLVRAHSIVNIVGAGSRHSGPYLVSGVRHIIDAATHLMEIELVRNGWKEGGGGTVGNILSKFL
jgi:hypothetical protein